MSTRSVTKGRDQGFSLVELLVVITILAILMAIAVPTLFGVRLRAQDTAAQKRLVTALKVEEIHATGHEGYTDDDGVLEGLEASLDWNATNDDAVHVLVASVVTTDDAVLLYTRSNSGSWFGLRRDRSGALSGRHTCAGAAETDVDEMTDCTGHDW